ncbi:polysaccharide pyruvyl transferase CsaB [Natranaerovirga hydrolytica]|uniref:Polysaccharide pyruvyl transferase CsaB n=1 Tax=Natranaerovirga hydrolytica TaxID=680378 RepID=A0A4R1MQ33_9FIRM|nr:polysaccharide pyruvyl transferase CsaB [Natranaerovirga hydrolytica]TCK93464.1 polysaccharide pyruvyl transferase CsaB [Natranaerovirga hydrolytica]
MKRVFVFGYYGFGNIGDEVTLKSIIDIIKDTSPYSKIDVLSYNSDLTSKNYKVNGVSRNKYFSIIKSIYQSDVVISGGGTLLQDITSNRSLMYYLLIIIIAKVLRKEVVFFSNGFGPVSNNKKLTRWVCNKVDDIILRDNDSKLAMESLGIHKAIAVTSDITFSLKGMDKKAEEKVAISLRPWKLERNFFDTMIHFVDYLLEKGYKVDLIAMEKESDRKVLNRIHTHFMKNNKVRIISSDQYMELFEAIGTSKFLIGMRLHANIFALINKRPIIALNYDPKVEALAKDFNQICIDIDKGFNMEQLQSSFEWLVKNQKDSIKNIENILKEKKRLLEYNKDVLKKKLK